MFQNAFNSACNSAKRFILGCIGSIGLVTVEGALNQHKDKIFNLHIPDFFINALADKGQPDKYLIAMKYLETMKAITSGQDNKVVYMPYEATGILSSVDGIKQMFDK